MAVNSCSAALLEAFPYITFRWIFVSQKHMIWVFCDSSNNNCPGFGMFLMGADNHCVGYATPHHIKMGLLATARIDEDPPHHRGAIVDLDG